MNWFIDAYRRYAQFDGRSRRQAYWMFFLFYMLVSLVLGMMDHMMGLTFGREGHERGVLGAVFGLVSFLPSLGITVRRLHDTEKSGWWVLIAFIPLIGIIVLLVMMCLEGTAGDNRYGRDPKLDPPPKGF